MNSQTPNNTVEIDLRKIWAAFVAQWKLIIAVGIICAAIVFAACSFLITPKYTTNTVIMILNTNKEEGQIASSDLTLSASLSTDFINIATSRTVLEEVDKRVGLDDAKVKAEIIQNTRQIKISVTHTNPEKAKEIADCVAEVASERICDIMDIPNMVRTVDKAFVPTSKSFPNTTRMSALGLIGGILITWLIVLIVFLSNDKINVTEDVEKYLDVPLLAVIPVYETRDTVSHKRGKSRKKGHSEAADDEIARRNIRTTATINNREKQAPARPATPAKPAKAANSAASAKPTTKPVNSRPLKKKPMTENPVKKEV